MERRLAAILAADVVGYSRLIRADEEGTLSALKSLRAEVIDPKLSEHKGRVVKLMGDGMLVEFPSVVDAVRAAAEALKAIADRNSRLPEDKRIEFRVGINLGDVLIDGDDIHGDGVNVAARLENLAQPGSLCISGAVYDLVRNRTDLAFEDLGDQQVKNIDQPVRVWRWPIGGAQKSALVSGGEPLALPDKPSIAVLPFTNLSGDPEQEHFANGITEELITRLSKLRSIFIISRSSTFVYKEHPVRTQQVARDLAVRHVLEGSMLRVGNRVRITARLVDGTTGQHVWAERYDRSVTDIFEVQDEITQSIAVALQIQLTEGETARLLAEGTRNLAAWEAVNSGIRFMDDHSQANNLQAQRCFLEALRHDPDYQEARAFLAFTYWMDRRFGFVSDTDRALTRAHELTKEIGAAGIRSTTGEQVTALIALIEGRHDDALAAAKTAVKLGPNNPWALLILGEIQIYCGNPQAAMNSVRSAMRLSPYGPADFVYYLAYAQMWSGDYDGSIVAAQNYAERSPNEPFAFTLLACVYSFAGKVNQARAAIDVLRAKFPSFTLETYALTQFYRDPDRLNRLLNALRKAGVPEQFSD